MGCLFSRRRATSSGESAASASNNAVHPTLSADAVAQLQREVAALRRANRDLEHRLRAHGATASGDLQTAVSDEQIRAFVDAMLANPDINIGFMPDIAERAAYMHGVRMGLGVLAHTLQTVRLEAVGHRFGVWMEPADASKTGVEHDDDDDDTSSEAHSQHDRRDRALPTDDVDVTNNNNSNNDNVPVEEEGMHERVQRHASKPPPNRRRKRRSRTHRRSRSVDASENTPLICEAE